ncbi:hypothetical protein LSG25_08880 [Paralcaligenes sp. KSB-10]|uniref:hypothetical protein n=1 Tax=Paralcaligenes sp. KSB-10 TaxID=2901142 RepID=UPI001E560296|nr:hypothetical protein [Paralcaligenes sp. KSB-10]UHL65956.1 hypothetical protein LSG25_08880 [Paralcaligenes sp. KSB-10]
MMTRQMLVFSNSRVTSQSQANCLSEIVFRVFGARALALNKQCKSGDKLLGLFLEPFLAVFSAVLSAVLSAAFETSFGPVFGTAFEQYPAANKNRPFTKSKRPVGKTGCGGRI